jgi:hypothetical protein
MAGIAVGQLPKMAINLCEKCRDERSNGLQIAEVAIDFRGDLRRLRIWTAVALQKPCQIGEPHSSRDAFPRNVSVRDEHLGPARQERREIPGEKPRREDFTCEL